jgi:predicted NBD/HSP70 family sugar kinase
MCMALRPPRQRQHSGTLAGTNLTRAGDYNQRVVLQAIRSKAAVTHSELAQLTGLTHQSAINISRRLLADGLIQDVGKTSGGRGQPAAFLAINPEGAYSLGLNIDRDHITLVLMDLQGRIRDRLYLDQNFALPEDVLAFVQSGLDRVLAQRRVPRKRLAGLGIAIPERLGGVNVSSRPSGYDAWASLDVVATFSEALKMPVYAENDATAAAIGELQFGLGQTYNTFVYTVISAGIGCGLIVDGQPFAGGLTHAGEIGNIPIQSTDPQKTRLWHVISLYALYDDLAATGHVVNRPEDLDEANPLQAAAIDHWVQSAADHMIEPFLTITYILSPEVHVLGGQLPAFISRKLCAALNARLPAYQQDVPLTPFLPSSTETDASAMGAAVLVFQNRFLPSPDVLKKMVGAPR